MKKIQLSSSSCNRSVDLARLGYLNKMPRHARIFIEASFIMVLASCTATSNPRVSSDSIEHPGLEVFLEFEGAVKRGVQFKELRSEFYSPLAQNDIDKAFGWAMFKYTAPFIALTDGYCDSIKIELTNGRPILTCVGKIVIKSIFIGDQIYDMELKIRLKYFKTRWYFDGAGLKQKNPQDDRSTIRGLIFW